MRRRAALALLLAGCSASPPPLAPEPRLDLLAFFTGKTEGRGRIAVAFQRDKPLHVESIGRADGTGTLVLDQRIAEGLKTRMRRWVMHCTAAGRCDGSLTDASGPVRVAVAGNRAHIGYAMKNGLAVEQWLTLRADRLTIDNRLEVGKLGIVIGRVDEVIRRTS